VRSLIDENSTTTNAFERLSSRQFFSGFPDHDSGNRHNQPEDPAHRSSSRHNRTREIHERAQAALLSTTGSTIPCTARASKFSALKAPQAGRETTRDSRRVRVAPSCHELVQGSRIGKQSTGASALHQPSTLSNLDARMHIDDTLAFFSISGRYCQIRGQRSGQRSSTNVKSELRPHNGHITRPCPDKAIPDEARPALQAKAKLDELRHRP